LVLATDAFGGHGGIAKFNRDLLSALCACPGVKEVVALPRLMPEPPGELPAKLRYVTSGVGGKLRYILAVLKAARSFPASRLARRTGAPSSPIPCSSLVVCGHINLLPIAWVAQRLIRKAESRKLKAETEAAGPRVPRRTGAPSTVSPLPAPCSLLLVVHGIDAWKPTHSRLANRLVRKVDGFVSVSEFTKQRFLAWSKLNGVRSFILPNCVCLADFTPGPKDSRLLERYGLRDRTVLLTVARLSAQERYKGIDEVIEVLPELGKQIPNLTYLVVGDGDDRERLVNKARSHGFAVRVDYPSSTTDAPPKDSRVRAPCSSLSSPQVLFTGRILESEKVDHYRLADAFVMPGWGEGFGIAYLEAMGCGVPVVASKLDASQEAVRNGDLGIVVNPKEPREIQRGILAALKRDRQVVPPGLEYFSAQNFETRVHRILEELWRQERAELLKSECSSL
jgi:glycosyltransferase involved in cell wall biosynthesis